MGDLPQPPCLCHSILPSACLPPPPDFTSHLHLPPAYTHFIPYAPCYLPLRTYGWLCPQPARCALLDFAARQQRYRFRAQRRLQRACLRFHPSCPSFCWFCPATLPPAFLHLPAFKRLFSVLRVRLQPSVKLSSRADVSAGILHEEGTCLEEEAWALEVPCAERLEGLSTPLLHWKGRREGRAHVWHGYVYFRCVRRAFSHGCYERKRREEGKKEKKRKHDTSWIRGAWGLTAPAHARTIDRRAWRLLHSALPTLLAAC